MNVFAGVAAARWRDLDLSDAYLKNTHHRSLGVMDE
jgi:hypothetical protein